MTVEEASLFFSYEPEDDLADLYDERLFEYKQFFLSKVPIRKVFEAKLAKLRQMEKAYVALSGAVLSVQPAISGFSSQYSTVIKEAFNQWEQSKARCKQLIMSASNAVQLEQAVQVYLSESASYWQLWFTEEAIDSELDSLSKEEDPMSIFGAITAFEQQGGVYFSDILTMKTNSLLLKEMKRVSLLIQKTKS